MTPSLFSRLNQVVRRPARSSARRAQAALLTVSFCGLAALWFIAQNLVAQVTEAEIRAQVAGRTFPLILAYGQGGILALTRETQRQAEFSQASGTEALFLLVDDRSQVLAGNYTYVPPPLQGLYPGEYEVVLYPRNFGATETNLGQAQAISVFRISEWTLIVGASLDLRDQLRRRLSLVFATVFFPTAILLGLISGRITRRLFARLERIAETARQVGAGRLATRITLTQANDEFDRLSATLNQMLERNEALLHALRTTTASLAHDLRTPLTRTYARLEETVRLLDTTRDTTRDATRDTTKDAPEPSGLAARSALEVALQEINHLRHTFDTLTAIVHAESGISAAFPDRLSYAALLQDVYDLYAPLAEEQGAVLVLRLPHEADTEKQDKKISPEVRGNRQLLFSALSNLVENALAHAQPSTPLRLELFLALYPDTESPDTESPNPKSKATDPSRASWHLGVHDNGTGMAPATRQRALGGFLFRPEAEAPSLAKTESSVPASDTGGLGLILVAAVARLHGGELTLTDQAAGFTASLVLPARQSDNEPDDTDAP